jgi:hypothetical protein
VIVRIRNLLAVATLLGLALPALPAQQKAAAKPAATADSSAKKAKHKVRTAAKAAKDTAKTAASKTAATPKPAAAKKP